ncbi:unnamed protein product [Lactuca virosa]|uniref:Uncharacterized protein n=1 Tax=Lactuca virosa TaxID=75947 RepID=A0AAU9MER0_9ASTR|nr:unnamed protein product [Lactuca virosa]
MFGDQKKEQQKQSKQQEIAGKNQQVIILARERCLNLELSDIPVQSLVPDPLKVVMQAGDAELEMRGRCSAGQKIGISRNLLP